MQYDAGMQYDADRRTVLLMGWVAWEFRGWCFFRPSHFWTRVLAGVFPAPERPLMVWTLSCSFDNYLFIRYPNNSSARASDTSISYAFLRLSSTGTDALSVRNLLFSASLFMKGDLCNDIPAVPSQQRLYWRS